MFLNMFLKMFIVLETAGAVSFLLDDSEVVPDLSEPLSVLWLRWEQDRVLLLLFFLLLAAGAGLKVGGDLLAGPELVPTAQTGEERDQLGWHRLLQLLQQKTLGVEELGLRFGAQLVENFDRASTTLAMFFSQVSQRLLFIPESRGADTALPILPAVTLSYMEQQL